MRWAGGAQAFEKTSFRVQFGAVARKNRTMLRRQCCSTFCFTFALPGLFLCVYIMLKVCMGAWAPARACARVHMDMAWTWCPMRMRMRACASR